MKVFLVVLAVAAAAIVHAQQPARPQIPETFEGEGYSHVVTVNETIWGLGRWVVDEPNDRSLEFWEFVHEHFRHSVHVLKRFDLHNEYSVMWTPGPTPHRVCHKRQVTPPMPPNWAWVKDATYRGKHRIDGDTYDVWSYHAGGVELEVAVSEHNANRPHYFTRRSASEQRRYHLVTFSTIKPNATWFNVPDVCKNVTAPEPVAPTIPSCMATAVIAFRMQAAHQYVNLIKAAHQSAGVAMPSAAMENMAALGSECVGGPHAGDVFFHGTPAKSAAVYIGSNNFIECPFHEGVACSIVPPRDFSGGCRRFCSV